MMNYLILALFPCFLLLTQGCSDSSTKELKNNTTDSDGFKYDSLVIHQLELQKMAFRTGLKEVAKHQLDVIEEEATAKTSHLTELIAFRKKCLSVDLESIAFQNYLEDLIDSTNNLNVKTEAIILLSENYFESNNYRKSYYLLSKALYLALSQKNNSDLASIYNLSGRIKFAGDQKISAKTDFFKGLYFAHQSKDTNQIARIHSNLANIENDFGNWNESKWHYERGILFSKQVNNQHFEFIGLINYTNALLAHKESDKAAQKLRELNELPIHTFSNLDRTRCEVLLNLTKLTFYLSEKDWSSFNSLLAMMNIQALKKNDNIYFLELLYLKANYYELKKQPIQELKIWKEIHLLEKEISLQKAMNSMQNFQTQFDNISGKLEINQLKTQKIKNRAIAEKQSNFYFVSFLLTAIITVLLVSFIYANYLRKNQRLQAEFSNKLVSVNDAFKKNLAMEIHDDLGVKLSFVRMQLSLLSSGAKISTELLEKEVLSSIQKLRLISHELFPNTLKNLKFEDSIKELFSTIRLNKAIDTAFTYSDFDMKDEMSIQIYRIVQECCNNTVKHSNATFIKLTIKKEGNRILVDYMDNGTGVEGIKNTGIGMNIIYERVRMMKGSSNVTIDRRNGFKLSLTIPY